MDGSCKVACSHKKRKKERENETPVRLLHVTPGPFISSPSFARFGPVSKSCPAVRSLIHYWSTNPAVPTLAAMPPVTAPGGGGRLPTGGKGPLPSKRLRDSDDSGSLSSCSDSDADAESDGDLVRCSPCLHFVLESQSSNCLVGFLINLVFVAFLLVLNFVAATWGRLSPCCGWSRAGPTRTVRRCASRSSPGNRTRAFPAVVSQSHRMLHVLSSLLYLL